MNNWQDLAEAVGQWSAANFGSQKGLGCLVPLMGMVEEVGEWYEANDHKDQDDALGDICIFLMDYCYRAGVDLSGVPKEGGGKREASLVESVGKLFHVQVKRIQGIRGMEDKDRFEAARLDAVTSVISKINLFINAFDNACKVWSDVVSKRKWHTVPDKPLTMQNAVSEFTGVAGELNRLS